MGGGSGARLDEAHSWRCLSSLNYAGAGPFHRRFIAGLYGESGSGFTRLALPTARPHLLTGCLHRGRALQSKAPTSRGPGLKEESGDDCSFVLPPLEGTPPVYIQR